MELNLTYEQSKEILGLGYDFSKVCWKSLYEYRDQYSLNQTFIKIHLHGTHLSLASIEDEIKCRMSKYGIVDLVTPIIPKAALLMALPSFERGVVSKDHEHLSFEIGSDFRFAYLKETHSGKIVKNFSSDDENPALIKAFLWCHQHYPEELKAKFTKELKM